MKRFGVVLVRGEGREYMETDFAPSVGMVIVKGGKRYRLEGVEWRVEDGYFECAWGNGNEV